MANPKYQFIESRANLGATLKAAFIKKQYHEKKEETKPFEDSDIPF